MESPFYIGEISQVQTDLHKEPKYLPHRHEREEIIILTHGSGFHFIDFNREEVHAPLIIYVAMGKIHHFLPGPDAKGWVILYSNEFLPQTNFQFYANFLERNNYEISREYCQTSLNSLCEIMLSEYQAESPNMSVIKHLLGAVLTKLESESKKEYLDEKASKNIQLITFNNFLKILEYNYKRNEGAEFYAEKLNMSSRNLNLICQAVFSKSMTDIIENRKIIESKNLLLNSELSISEIGYELGYNEKSYFTRVFRKKTGVTPSEFRTQMQGVMNL